MIVKVSGCVRMQRSRESTGVGEDGGAGKGGYEAHPINEVSLKTQQQ
jgi:hypothetical protein